MNAIANQWLPCPFCGGTDIRHHRHRGAGHGDHRGEDVYSMCCYTCGATFPNRYSLEPLRESWNRRPTGGVADAPAAQPYNYASKKPADQVRELLVQAGLSQRQAARELDITDRMMRYYCSGDQDVPKAVMLALEHLVCLQRKVT